MSRPITVCSLTLLLAACASHAPLPAPAVAAAGPGREAAAQADIPPYLAHRPPVPQAAQQRFDDALLALDGGDRRGAVTRLEELAGDYPELSGPSLNLALLYRDQGEDDAAEAWFRRSIDRNPANLTAYNQFAIFLREQGRFEEAEGVYGAALAVWEPDPETHRNLGILYDLYLGDRERALASFQRYQALVDGRDREVAGWIVDLQRRSDLLVQGGQP